MGLARAVAGRSREARHPAAIDGASSCIARVGTAYPTRGSWSSIARPRPLALLPDLVLVGGDDPRGEDHVRVDRGRAGRVGDDDVLDARRERPRCVRRPGVDDARREVRDEGRRRDPLTVTDVIADARSESSTAALPPSKVSVTVAASTAPISFSMTAVVAAM